MSCPFDPSTKTVASQQEASCPFSGTQAPPTSAEVCPFNPASEKTTQTDEVPPPTSEKEIPIPQPPETFLLGNLPDVDPVFSIGSIWKLKPIYGDIFKLNLKGNVIFISSRDLVDEVCNEDRFEKFVSGPLKEVRALTGDGLFTAHQYEPAWGIAHRTLMPVFGPIAIRKMFPQMLDISSQMILNWDRLGPDHVIDSADDFTRLAFDTIAFCACSYRFNSFLTPDPPTFATQMAEVLVEAGKRAMRPNIENNLRVWSAKETESKIKDMWKLGDDLVAERRAHPQPENSDLLNTMLYQKDPLTGHMMTDENIRFNLTTFLVAGHETTSGTLAFMWYLLLKDPEKLHKAQKEVDEVLGDNAIELKHLSQLKYVEACIRETLRVQSPIGALAMHAKEETLLAGKYRVKSNEKIQVNVRDLHRDRKVWGDDADDFRPERLLNGGWEALPRNAWKPFGNGARACIGRALAEQEMLIATALMLQRFQVEMADPSYDLQHKSTLTIKPDHFGFKVRRRPGKDIMVGIPGAPSAQVQAAAAAVKSATTTTATEAKPLTVVYGSNAGTCKNFAEDLAANGEKYGFQVKVQTMDSITEALPTDHPLVIISPSYEGKPADNAKKFVTWLEAHSTNENLAKGVKYAVFGAGNSEWFSTFHRIPKLVNDLLDTTGGQRICDIGLVDVKEDLMGPWEDWTEKLWAALREDSGTTTEVVEKDIDVKFEPADAVSTLAGEEMSCGIVKENRVVAEASEFGPEKRHTEIELPEGMSYQTGDYLVVLPSNHPDDVKRVLRRFKLQADDIVSISGTKKTFLTGKTSLSVHDLISNRVELATPASFRQVETLANATTAKDSKIHTLTSKTVYETDILPKRFSVLDLLEDYPECTLSFAKYLDMVQPLKPRQYSVASSILANHPTSTSPSTPQHIQETAAIHYDVHNSPSLSTTPTNPRTHHGVASTYLASLRPGDKLHCTIRPTNTSFHLPTDPTTPVIMIAAGSGIAPMRGFLSERAAIKKGGAVAQGQALLYYGCRSHEKDFVYSAELKKWEDEGVVSVRPAFSRQGPEGEEKYRYVQDRMWEERKELEELYRGGAKIFLCGSAGRLARGVEETLVRIWRGSGEGRSEGEGREWLEGVREGRYVSDVFD
ncbi:bifunctional P-450/NADPH-P450 reductase [Aulographum hederae CBS 113979]|uniref:Bifunctional cytochrome P450/NADPH--P450 reductase n=1 Tax=Aulographum hederae CBS 113979 TaxID=1176131 RepID=A0A6G1GM66_9PEZI|nr:bifunctional P-450/NADPH-P450 reductase [Aulographum hederae CBS 113979]